MTPHDIAAKRMFVQFIVQTKKETDHLLRIYDKLMDKYCYFQDSAENNRGIILLRRI